MTIRPTVALALLCMCLTGCKKSPDEGGEVRIKSIKRIDTPDTPARPKRPRQRPPRRYSEQVTHDPSSVLGGEQGLDHVGVAVKDLNEAGQIYTRLGFGNPQEGTLPNGLRNINFYFGDTTYLELVTYYDKAKNPWVASFVDRHEKGAMFLMLCVFSYTHTANFLRARHLEVENPLPGRIESHRAKKAAAQPGRKKAPMWLNFFLKGKTLPGNVTFIAYNRGLRNFTLGKLKDEKIRRKSFTHPNTVLGLRSAWIAVDNLAQGRKAFEAIGLKAGRRFDDTRIDARGVAIAAGQGTLRLLQPRVKGRGPVAAFLKRRGQGIIGLGFEVENVKTAGALIEERLKTPVKLYDGLLGKSVLVPADQALDVYLEFAQRP